MDGHAVEHDAPGAGPEGLDPWPGLGVWLPGAVPRRRVPGPAGCTAYAFDPPPWACCASSATFHVLRIGVGRRATTGVLRALGKPYFLVGCMEGFSYKRVSGNTDNQVSGEKDH